MASSWIGIVLLASQICQGFSQTSDYGSASPQLRWWYWTSTRTSNSGWAPHSSSYTRWSMVYPGTTKIYYSQQPPSPTSSPMIRAYFNNPSSTFKYGQDILPILQNGQTNNTIYTIPIPTLMRNSTKIVTENGVSRLKFELAFFNEDAKNQALNSYREETERCAFDVHLAFPLSMKLTLQINKIHVTINWPVYLDVNDEYKVYQFGVDCPYQSLVFCKLLALEADHNIFTTSMSFRINHYHRQYTTRFMHYYVPIEVKMIDDCALSHLEHCKDRESSQQVEIDKWKKQNEITARLNSRLRDRITNPKICTSTSYTCFPMSINVSLDNVNSTDQMKGRLIVSTGDYPDARSGTVCDDYFTDVDATVVCRQLYGMNYYGQRSFAYRDGTGPIWMDDVICSGAEKNLSECVYLGWGKHNCRHNEDIGIECYKKY